MEWEKAKTILVILLVLLNAVLFVMGIYSEKKYKLTPERIQAICTALQKNGIELECSLPLENRPVKLLNLAAAEWDYDYIMSAFFEGENVTRTLEEGSVIYRSDGGRSVTVTNAQTTGEASELVFTEEKASFDEPGEYIGLIGKQFSSFTLQRARKDAYGASYLYNEAIKERPVFVSSAEVSYLGEGVVVRVRKYDFLSYAEGEHEIFGADEALLTFLHYKNQYIEYPVSIEAVQLGYGVPESREEALRAKPYYRIFIKGDSEPVYIDAVMNTVIDISK